MVTIILSKWCDVCKFKSGCRGVLMKRKVSGKQFAKLPKEIVEVILLRKYGIKQLHIFLHIFFFLVSLVLHDIAGVFEPNYILEKAILCI